MFRCMPSSQALARHSVSGDSDASGGRLEQFGILLYCSLSMIGLLSLLQF